MYRPGIGTPPVETHLSVGRDAQAAERVNADYCVRETSSVFAQLVLFTGNPCVPRPSLIVALNGTCVCTAALYAVRRYAHLAAYHLALYAECLCALRAVESESDGTFTAQT